MRQECLQERTAEVRTAWTLRERVERARASEQRCQELLGKLGLASGRRGPRWAAKSPAAVSG